MTRKPRPPRRKPVFTEFKRAKLLRKRIPLAEAGSGLAVLLVLLLAAGWVRAQRDNFDPAERDLDLALLEARGAPRELYDRPVQRWRDPATPAASAAATDLGPFPASLVMSGWSAGRLQRFSPETLYEKINGQAEQYLKFGFRELVVLPLEHPASGASLDVFLYDQAEAANALGLLAEQRGDKPSEKRGALHYTETGAGAFGAVGSFVFHLVGAPDGPDLRAQTNAALEALTGLAVEADLPAPQRLLIEGLGLSPERIAYTPVNAFQLSFAERFWFGTLDASPTTRAFLHEAESEEAAAALLDRLISEQEAELEALVRGDRSVSLKHRYLGTYYGMAVEGAWLLGVEDHPDAEAMDATMDRLRSALLQPGSTDDSGEDGP